MSVHLRVYAELNDFVKPDEQYTVLRCPFRPYQMESPECREWPRCKPGAVAGSVRPGQRNRYSDNRFRPCAASAREPLWGQR